MVAGHWVFGNTGLLDNSLFGGTYDGTTTIVTAGTETDRYHDGHLRSDIVSPAGFARLASVFLDGDRGNETGTMGLFFTSGGGCVFTGATEDWARGLSQDSVTWSPVDQITVNVVDGLAGSFHVLPGLAYDISVGASGAVCVVGTDNVAGGHGIYTWNGSGWLLTPGTGALRVATDPTGNPWVVDNAQRIYRYVGGSAPWQQLPGAALDIGIGANGIVWVVGTDKGLYKWNGSTWLNGGGGPVLRVAVDPLGQPWTITSAGVVRKLVGGIGGTWTALPALAFAVGVDIGVGPEGTVWIVGGSVQNGGAGIFRWTGSHWAQVAGGAANISVAPGGAPWITTSTTVIESWA
jgi:hypothetical protein